MSIGIYIHIPFCQSKCSYCHFISTPLCSFDEPKYHEAILREMRSYSEILRLNGDADSIYLGGGTPSLIPAGHIEEAVELCRIMARVAEECEISLESNPGTLTSETAQAYRRCGINRISVGAQSFNNGELTSIGRLHNAEMIRQSVRLLHRAGFHNINLDLMLGLPGQSAQSWRRTLVEAVKLEVPHLSVYMLDLDDQCPLQDLVNSGSVRLPEEDLVSDLYIETIEFLSENGYGQYEISNFAKHGYICRHNMKYWQREIVFGFGVGSHSYDGFSRYANNPQMDRYVESVACGKTPVSWKEPVSPKQSLSEALFLGLRLRQGVDWSALKALHGSEQMSQFEPGMRDLSEKGLVQWNGSIVRLTESGMLLSNEIFQLFV